MSNERATDAAPLVTPALRELTLILVRHGETGHNAEGRIQGQTDTFLSDKGREQAERLGRRLVTAYQPDLPLLPGPPTLAFTSDLRRAAETAEIVVAGMGTLAPPLLYTPLLRERHFGIWQGLTGPEIRTRYAGITEPEGGETDNDVWNRMASAFEFMVGECQSCGATTALVFGHGGSLRSLLVRAIGASPETVRAFSLRNTGVVVATYSFAEDGTFSNGRLLVLNDTAHLL